MERVNEYSDISQIEHDSFELFRSMPSNFTSELKNVNNDRGIIFGITGDPKEELFIEIAKKYHDSGFNFRNINSRDLSVIPSYRKLILEKGLAINTSCYNQENPSISKEIERNGFQLGIIDSIDPLKQNPWELLQNFFEKLSLGSSVFANYMPLLKNDIEGFVDFYNNVPVNLRLNTPNTLNPFDFKEEKFVLCGMSFTKIKDNSLLLPDFQQIKTSDFNNEPVSINIPRL